MRQRLLKQCVVWDIRLECRNEEKDVVCVDEYHRTEWDFDGSFSGSLYGETKKWENV